ncbi:MULTISPECIES: exopolysaccharide transport family protein [Alphaproteobacteria]|uniref:Chain-length determining protein n=2 Tax=Alphaproteobacteria TaxID=28211 RepID=A0A512HGR2_9HYPH|nr:MULTISPECIES: Wzz/FepE/Etk N-terminal domain-containing protein [Alphaproteobacteria]GEO84632.1 chain-length determining protein [Ciceribacter naphthalenivorans]GLR22595.1 chain-length determining protein [Ciceribacter naphthalenivorans]GLT05451.1 chain-length determining protein [Sphingomonas psychrolutea]
MSSVSNDQQDVDIDLSQLFRAVWNRKARILAATALVGALAFVGASMISPQYSAETRILIEPREPIYTTQTNVQAPTEQLSDELNIASQVQILQSVDLIKQVARDLKLYKLREFDPDTSPSALSDLLVMLGLKENPLDMAPEERVLKTFQENLQVYQVEKSRVIGIQFTSKDPKLAAEIPNAIATVYRSLQSGAKLDSNSQAARWLEPEIANLREKVKEAEGKVAEYRASADLMPINETTNFSSQQLSDISAELARVRGERADAEAKAENVRNALKAGKSTDTLVAITGNESIQRLKASESEIRSRIADLSTTLLDGHPQMKALRAQLAGIHDQITAESAKIASGLENEANVARARETQLIQQLNTVKADTARAGNDEVGLKALEREATAQRQLLETYLARYREATTRLDKGASPADARVISKAVEPREASFPKVVPITVVAALATLILSAVIVMLSELFSGRALRPVDPGLGPARPEPGNRREPQAKSDGFVPVSSPGRGAVAAGNVVPASLLAVEPDEELAASMEEGLILVPEAEPEVDEDDDEFSIESVAAYLIDSGARIAFAVSPSGDDGSTASVMLARELDARGRKVVLIDMTGSACPTRLMAAGKDLPGITDLLCGEAGVSEVIHPDRLSGADVIPQGNSDVRQAMRGAYRFSATAEALADAYDLVLVECGPANAESVSRLSHSGAHEVILSVPRPDEQDLVEIMAAFEKVGYVDLVLMCGGAPNIHKALNRSAA